LPSIAGFVPGTAAAKSAAKKLPYFIQSSV
jgi:hypothetical protein